jgi:hypothetical protein
VAVVLLVLLLLALLVLLLLALVVPLLVVVVLVLVVVLVVLQTVCGKHLGSAVPSVRCGSQVMTPTPVRLQPPPLLLRKQRLLRNVWLRQRLLRLLLAVV